MISFLPLWVCAQSSFTVTMHIKGLGMTPIKVVYQKNGKSKLDTLRPESPDLIIWKGEVAEPHFARMDVMDTSLYLRVGKAIMAPPQLQILLANADIKIEGVYDALFAVKVKSKDLEITEYEKLRMKDLPIAEKIWELNKEQNRKARAGDTTGNYALAQDVRALRKQNQELRIQFVNEHPKNFSSILILQSLMLILKPEDMLEKFDNIDAKFKDTEAAKNLSAKIEGNRKTAIGKPVVAFAQMGADGKMVDIAALKGKVVLIDFWGSWCVPCRKSHPALKAMYAKYKSRGLEIVGVANEAVVIGKSIKDQEASWRKAIKEDDINWLHILYNADIRDIVKEYDIMGYPTKYLIDQNGNYVLKIPGNSEEAHRILEAKLEELMPTQK